MLVAVCRLPADEVAMQNGDRYFGKVLTVTADAVVLQSEVLGKVSVRRKDVVALAFGTNGAALSAVARSGLVSTPTNYPFAARKLVNTNVNVSAVLHRPDAGTNVIGQIRSQMLAGSPEAAAKYDEMVSGLLNGSMNMNDLRREAQADADQLRALKRDLGPEADESLDGYLQVLDAFLKAPEFAGATNEADGP